MARRLFLALGFAVLVLVLALWRSLFVVDEGTTVVRTRFGAIVRIEAAPGLYAGSPLDQTHALDQRLLTRLYPGENFASADQKALNVDFYIKWRLQDPRRYFSATGGDEDTTAQRLVDVVRSQIKTAVARLPLARVGTDWRTSLGDAGLAAMRAAAANLGVEFVDVQLQRVGLSDELADAAYQRMQQDLSSQAQQLRTTGSTEAEKIRADADRQRAEIQSNGVRESQQLRGEADAQASAAYARAYGRNAEFAAFYRSMQAYKNTLGRDGDILVITPDGEFFKYLHSATGR